ncbi:MAG: hypothetical protein KatS3mg007_0005 [Thermoanaerobaculum sp.]|nr:MAG: hypothetical protein KatS3mg007_0005 [Thermoanaerobaculum sp.]
MRDPKLSVEQALVVGHELVVRWRDGHESYFPGDMLRKACPCAGCKGEKHLFGKATLPTLKPMSAQAFVPVAVRLVGNYGVQVVWADGHDHGIYHVEDLRRVCPCPQCGGSEKEEEPDAPLA